MGGERGDVQRVRKLNRVCNNGRWGTGGCKQKVPDTRKARASQDPMEVKLAEVPNKRESEPVKTISGG